MFQRTLLRLQVPKRSILSRQCISSSSSSSSCSAEDKFLFNQHESKKLVSLTNLNKMISDSEESEKFTELWKHNIFPDSNLMSTENIDLYFGMILLHLLPLTAVHSFSIIILYRAPASFAC